MQRIFRQIAERKERTQGHAFFSRAHEISEDSVVEKLRIWAPLFVHLAMTFRDINRMYYVYPTPSSDFERAINAHAKVDGTHWQLLIDDLRAIGVDKDVGGYGDAVRAIWSDRGEPIRNYMYWVLHRAQRCASSPFLKIVAMESGEATVKLFFSTTSHVASAFERKTGAKLGYFGNRHVESEIDNAVDLRPFEAVVLDDETLRHARWIVEDHFEKFNAFLDYKLQITFPK